VRYGKAFGGTYGWAAEALGNPNPKFFHIEQSVGVERLRPFFKMASYNVHANPKGVLFRLGLLTKGVLLAGPSNAGLADPGQNTAFSLTLITSSLIQLCPSLDVIIAVKIMNVLSKEIGQMFVQVHRALEAETYQ